MAHYLFIRMDNEIYFADMAELADALDLGSSAFGRGGSTPFIRIFAGLAQLVEHLICNQAVEGSTPLAGIFILTNSKAECSITLNIMRK